MRRQWVDVAQAKLVKHHAMRQQKNTLSLREQKEDQNSVAKILEECSHEGMDCLRDCIQQVCKHSSTLSDIM